MKKQMNIEKQFEQLPSAYQVPDNYFESLETKMLVDKNVKKQKTFSLKKSIIKMMIAASVLLLVSLGYYRITSSEHINGVLSDSIHNTQNTLVENNTLDDLTDDEIIDYLADENDLEFDIE